MSDNKSILEEIFDNHHYGWGEYNRNGIIEEVEKLLSNQEQREKELIFNSL